MAYSTMRTASLLWRCGVSHLESFQQSPNINYICVPTTEEVKTKIILTLGSLVLQGQPTLAQYWAAKRIGNTFVLTTTNQPFGLMGINEDLVAYHKACLDYKLYVYKHPEYPSKRVAFGLSGRVFLSCSPEQTRDVHGCPPDQRPPCEEAIFTKKWGAFALPVIVDDQCVGVLEFVVDIPWGSYEHDIDEVYRALECAGLQSSNRIYGQGWTRIKQRVIKRVTSSVYTARYNCLAPHFGLSKADAAQMLGLKEGTFRNVCRDVGIPEWPMIRKKQRASKTSSLATMFADLISSWEEEIATQANQEAPLDVMPGFAAMEYGSNNDNMVNDDTNLEMEEWINALYADHNM